MSESATFAAAKSPCANTRHLSVSTNRSLTVAARIGEVQSRTVVYPGGVKHVTDIDEIILGHGTPARRYPGRLGEALSERVQ